MLTWFPLQTPYFHIRSQSLGLGIGLQRVFSEPTVHAHRRFGAVSKMASDSIQEEQAPRSSREATKRNGRKSPERSRHLAPPWSMPDGIAITRKVRSALAAWHVQIPAQHWTDDQGITCHSEAGFSGRPRSAGTAELTQEDNRESLVLWAVRS